MTQDDYQNSLYLDSETELKDGIRTVTLTIDEPKLKSDISKDKVCVVALPLTDEDLLDYMTNKDEEARFENLKLRDTLYAIFMIS